MKIFKSFALLAGVAFVTTHASAQATTQNNLNTQEMAQKLTAEVKRTVTGITPDQESKITAVEQDYAKSMNDVRNSSNGDRAAMNTKMQPLMATRDTKIKTILTVDQYAQYQKAEAAHSGNSKGRN